VGLAAGCLPEMEVGLALGSDLALAVELLFEIRIQFRTCANN